MRRFHRYEIDAAAKGFDAVPWLAQHGFEGYKDGEEWVGTCPVCSKPKLSVNVTVGAWRCFICENERGKDGRGGLPRLVQLLEDCTFPEAIKMMLERQGQTSPPDVTMEQQDPQERPLVPIAYPEGATRFTSLHPYLARRGLTMQDVAAFGLYHCTHGRYRNRLIFPCWMHGQHVFFQARAMWEKSEHTDPDRKFIKAMNPSWKRDQCPNGARQVLFNFDQAVTWAQAGHRVALVEGPIDAVKTGPTGLATFGHSLSTRQATLLRQYGVRKIDWMWDADALDSVQHFLPQLDGLDVRVVLLPQDKDPGDLQRYEIDQLRVNSIPVQDFWHRGQQLEIDLL